MRRSSISRIDGRLFFCLIKLHSTNTDHGKCIYVHGHFREGEGLDHRGAQATRGPDQGERKRKREGSPPSGPRRKGCTRAGGH